MTETHLVLSFVGSTGSTTISFILPGLFYWKASILLFYFMRVVFHTTPHLQLTRNDPTANKFLNRAALVLAMYGACIFVFW
jgi:amino acid permease